MRTTADFPKPSSGRKLNVDSCRSFVPVPRYVRIQRYSTDNAKNTNADKPTSIFKMEGDTWDHVFKGIKNMPPLTSSALRNPASQTPRRVRRQAMSATELSAFDDMFTMIFDAVSEQKSSEMRTSGTQGKTSDPGGLNDLFGKLRKHSKRMRWTTEEEELLDRKKEAMDLCDTDQELLEWAIREVFDESQKFEAASREALQKVTSSPNKTSAAENLPILQSPIYPHIIAHLMRTFRDKYHDPHLALSIFDHARNLSIPSYVFGCTTPAYNELIETKWTHFHDLKGVHDALQEMVINGVDVNDNTRKIVDGVRRQVGERNLWIEDDYFGEGELWDVLKSIESLVRKPEADSDRSKRWNDWKTSTKADKDWAFNQWDTASDSTSNSKRY
ncbi:protein [Lentinula edodes]|uniref:Protein n=1 Tax=Lentinula edodes TaxID=5353 RepID=A0A1Q3EEG4_LENED|nr:protein [Lentinula edodes]